MVSTPHAGARDGWPAARDRIWAKHGLAKFATRYDTKAKHLAIDLISVPAESKGQGNASRAMKDALAWADDHGVTVTLSPTSEFGSSKARLTKWYRSLGFVPNKGRNKDFRFTEAMIRPPTTQTMASSPKRSPAKARKSAPTVVARIRLTANGYEVEGPFGPTPPLPSKRALVVEVDRLLRAKPRLIVVGDKGSIGPNTVAVPGSAPAYAVKDLQGGNVAEGDDPRDLWNRKFSVVIGSAPMKAKAAKPRRATRTAKTRRVGDVLYLPGSGEYQYPRTLKIVEIDGPNVVVKQSDVDRHLRFDESTIKSLRKATPAQRKAVEKREREYKNMIAGAVAGKPKTNKNGQARELIKEYKLDVVGNDVRQAAQIAAKVRKGIQEAADICKISPPVCVGNLGLPRSKMPQIEGDLSVVELLGGDRANPPKGEAIIAAGGSPTDERTTLDQFLDALEDKGVKTRRRRVPVGNLKATQREIKAAKVYGMADAHLRGNFPNLDKQIVVSNDGHILDGHHRWAALLTIDPKRRMSVLEVDLPMAELLHEAAATPGVYRANFAGAPLGTAAQREYKRTHRSKLRGGSKSRPRLSKSAAWKEILG